MKNWFSLFFVVTLFACSTEEYRYMPSDENAQSHHKAQGAQYNIPDGQPEGQIQVVSMGIVEARVGKDQNQKEKPPAIRALLLRVTLSADVGSKSAITFDTKNQSVSFPNQTQSMFVGAIIAKQNVAEVTVVPGEIKTFDLYFGLPEVYQSENELPAFNFNWKLKVGEIKIAKTTQFDRIPIPQPYVVTNPYYVYPYGGFGPGWSSYGWWYSGGV